MATGNKGNVLSHNTQSSSDLQALLEEQKLTNLVLCRVEVCLITMIKHLELMTDAEINLDEENDLCR